MLTVDQLEDVKRVDTCILPNRNNNYIIATKQPDGMWLYRAKFSDRDFTAGNCQLLPTEDVVTNINQFATEIYRHTRKPTKVNIMVPSWGISSFCIDGGMQ